MARLGLSSSASDHGCPKILVVFASTVSPLNIPIPLVSLCVPESSVFGDTLGKGVARRGKVRTPSSAISWTTSSSSKSRGAKPVGGQARAERAGGRSAGSRPPLSPQPTKSSSTGFTEPRSTTLLLLAMGTAAAVRGGMMSAAFHLAPRHASCFQTNLCRRMHFAVHVLTVAGSNPWGQPQTRTEADGGTNTLAPPQRALRR